MTDGYTGKRFRSAQEGAPAPRSPRPGGSGGHFAQASGSARPQVGGAAAGRRPAHGTSSPMETAEFMAMSSARPAPRREPVAPVRPADIAAGPVVPPTPVGGATRPAPISPTTPVVPPRGPRKQGPYASDPEPPRRRGRNFLSTVLIVVGVVLLLVAGGMFVKAQLGYRAAQSTYENLQQYAVQDSEGDNVPAVDFDELAKINPDVVGWIYVPDTVISYPVVQNLQQYAVQDSEGDNVPAVDFDELAKINPDVVGWIYVPDTVISYPVVQTTNNDKYLYKLFDLSGNGSGSIFMDMDDTAPGVVDQQTTLYGHHMYDGSMFKIIDDTLSSQEAFDKFDKVYYITRESTFVFKPLFTAQVVDEYVDARRANFDGELTLEKYLEQTLEQAKSVAADAEERIPETKQVLSLVTCAGEVIPRTTRAVMVCSLEETIERQ